EFSERMDPATLTLDTCVIQDTRTGRSVPGMIQVEADGRTASFVPAQPYAAGHDHVVFLNPNGTIKDAAGNSLGSYAFVFITAFVADSERPRLVATSPVAGDHGVPLNAVVILDFSEPLHGVNVLHGIQVLAATNPVAGSVALSNGNRRVTFTPAAALLPTTPYTVVLSTAITDLAGNPLDNPG